MVIIWFKFLKSLKYYATIFDTPSKDLSSSEKPPHMDVAYTDVAYMGQFRTSQLSNFRFLGKSKNFGKRSALSPTHKWFLKAHLAVHFDRPQNPQSQSHSQTQVDSNFGPYFDLKLWMVLFSKKEKVRKRSNTN